MITRLTRIFKKVKKDLKLSQNFRIEKNDFTDVSKDCHWIYYRDKLVCILNKDNKSIYGFKDIRNEIRITLLLTNVLQKKTTCRLRRK